MRAGLTPVSAPAGEEGGLGCGRDSPLCLLPQGRWEASVGVASPLCLLLQGRREASGAGVAHPCVCSYRGGSLWKTGHHVQLLPDAPLPRAQPQASAGVSPACVPPHTPPVCVCPPGVRAHTRAHTSLCTHTPHPHAQPVVCLPHDRVRISLSMHTHAHCAHTCHGHSLCVHAHPIGCLPLNTCVSASLCAGLSLTISTGSTFRAKGSCMNID